MRVLPSETPPLRLWHLAPETPIGVPLSVIDDTTGKPLTGTDLTSLTGKLAVTTAGAAPSGVDDSAYVDFGWVKWADDFGEVQDVAAVLIGPGDSADTSWPADAGSVVVWWQVSDGEKTMAGQAPGSIDLY